jgi:two-component sensor histidine kinase
MIEQGGEGRTRSLLFGIADKLSGRFAVVLALALLPLGIVSLTQTSHLQAEIQGRTEAALLGETLRAAAGEIGLIRNVQGVVAAMAVAPEVVENPASCVEFMRQTAAQVPTATLVAFVPTSGKMTCSSTGQSYDFSDNPIFAKVMAAKAPHFVVNRAGPVSGTSVLGVSHPVFGPAGDLRGIVTVSLPHSGFAQLDSNIAVVLPEGRTQPVFWTFDRSGEILTASGGLDDVQLQRPSTRPLVEFAGQPGGVFQDTSNSGVRRTYAVVPIVSDQLYLMSSWEMTDASVLNQYGLTQYLPPIIMWIVGLIVAGVAAERLVTRHIRVLNKSILRFANGDRRLQEVDLRAAPVELRELGDAFVGMTESITLGEAQLEDSIHQKEVLLREVHHRVKNNLQLIVSVMNMQMRKAIAPEAKLLLKGLQERVMSLATIHRGLYQTTGLVDVRADELFKDIVRQIINLSSGMDRKIELRTDVDDLHLIPDQAVPLSLLLTEAMTNAMKYVGTSDGRPARIEVRLKREGDRFARMEVNNSLRSGAEAAGKTVGNRDFTSASTGLGAQLMMAFAQQIGGKLEQTTEGDEYRLSVVFKISPLNEGENRREPAETEDIQNA